MRKILSITFLVVGIICFSIATVTTIAFGFTVGNAMGLSAGIFFITLYFLYPKFSPRLRKWITVVLLFATGFAVGMIIFIAIKGARNTATFREDAVLVLGSGIKGEKLLLTLQQRLDKCIDYLQHNPGVLVVVSGGQGRNEDIPEATAMKRYLVAKGIDPAQIIEEMRSRDTKENMQLSKAIFDNYFAVQGKQNYTVVCITSDFHAQRAALLAKRYGLHVTHYNAPVAWYLRPSTYCREVVSYCKLWVTK